ncbi:ribonuclease HI [Micromonospora echinospora]|uniref:ribonuclease HI n=1 Tax=Micromonospora echinospora TaxID=1877 RepID=UPI0037B7E2DE
MRSDEFLRDLDLFPAARQHRLLALRHYLRTADCDACQRVGDAVQLAFTAARYDELAAADELLHTAEQLAAGHDAHRRSDDDPGHGRGRVDRWAATSTPLLAATDASWKGRVGGLGYVVTDGRYGLRGRGTGRLDPTGPSRVLVNELRAVDFLLTAYDEPPPGLAVLLDSLGAVEWLHRWQAGETGMPAGYRLRERRWATQPTLLRLAAQVAGRPDLVFAHVKGHSGHPLNEAADALAHMARRRRVESFDLRPRAHDLVDAFLRDWHTAAV